MATSSCDVLALECLYLQEVWHAERHADDSAAAVCPGAAGVAWQAWGKVGLMYTCMYIAPPYCVASFHQYVI